MDEQITKTKKIALKYYSKRLQLKLIHGRKVSKRSYAKFLANTVFKNVNLNDTRNSFIFNNAVNSSWAFAQNHFKAKARRFKTSTKISKLSQSYLPSNINAARALEYAYMSELINLNANDLTKIFMLIKIILEDNQNGNI